MTISATKLGFGDDTMRVGLTDGRTIGVALAWFPRTGLHWEDTDDDISVAALIAGRGDKTKRVDHAAE